MIDGIHTRLGEFANDRSGRTKGITFALLWIVVFVLYYPAALAGRVGDFPGWVKNVSTMPFLDYVNRTESHIPSLYQFTQVITWTFYQLFKSHAWPWHLLYVTMQAVNGYLAFLLGRHMLTDTGVKNSGLIALGGALLFCICPHISEVVVWEPSYHYLQGLILMYLVLLYTRRYIRTLQPKYAWIAGIIFLLSTYSLEMFYLTPVFVVLLALYYHMALGYERRVVIKTLTAITLPQVILFAAHLILINAIYHSGIGHIGTQTMHVNADNLSKPVKYIFHLIFFGRYWHDSVRQQVYRICEYKVVLAVFYLSVAALVAYIALRIRNMRPAAKAASLYTLIVLCCAALICPITFPDTFIAIYDRYTYVLDSFLYTLLCLLLGMISIPVIVGAVWGIYALLNVYFTHRINKMWQQSGNLVNKLTETFPNDPTKTVLILNVPECYYGVQMIGSREEGEFAIMYNAMMPQKLTNPVMEVSAYNMTDMSNGAHVTVMNDSTLHVTLNQWGTWWWWFGLGAINFENEYYRIDVKDPGHWYELTLKKQPGTYLLLYQVGDQWKHVDMHKKEPQD